MEFDTPTRHSRRQQKASWRGVGANDSLRRKQFDSASSAVTELVTEFLLRDGISVKFGNRKC